MKIKYLITLPLVALMASCGTQSDGISNRVKQKLPSDVEKISEKDEEYTSAIAELIKGVTNLTLQDTLYSFHTELDITGSGKLFKNSVKEDVKVSGDVALGFAKAQTVDDIDYYKGYVGITNFTVKAHLEIPVAKEVEGDDEEAEPEYEIKKYDLNYENLSVYGYYLEDVDGANMYLNVSDAKVQDMILTVLNMVGIGSVAQYILPSIFGPKDSTTTYGKVYVNVTDALINALVEAYGFEDASKVPEMFKELCKHPFALAFAYLKGQLDAQLTDAIINIGAQTIADMKPQVGVKRLEGSEEGYSNISLAYNTTIKALVERFGGKEAAANNPNSGSIGVFVSAGTETGSKELALQQLVFKADAKAPIELGDDQGKVNTTEKIDLSLDASYGTKANVPSIPTGELLSKYFHSIAVETMLTSAIATALKGALNNGQQE